MKIAIITRPDFRSPRILADSLKERLEENGVDTEVISDLSFLSRMISFKNSQLSFHFWLLERMIFWFKDKRTLKKFKDCSCVIISECIPRAFLKKAYNIEKFQKFLKKPVGFYEVFFLGNAPTQIRFLEKNNGAPERYDFHLSVTSSTEIKAPSHQNWFPIGIKAKGWNLIPAPKRSITAIIDFERPGYETYRQAQKNALKKVGIEYISLEKNYSIKEIREIYQDSALYFIQFPEAFGLPILECLCCGCQVFTPSSAWPMSWRLDEHPQVHEEGILPGCFTVYQTEDDLVDKLQQFKENYDLVNSPKRIFENFLSHYPDFYYGNDRELQRALKHISAGHE